MNNREVNAVIHNSEFTIIRTKFSSVRHNYDYHNSWQYATPNLEFSKDNYDNLQR
ncbi:hypothetical protein [Prevotella sp.]